MASKFTPYRYEKGADAALDAQFQQSPVYGKLRPGSTHLFWKSGFHWYCIPFSRIRQIYRRQSLTIARLCAGGRTYTCDYLVLLLPQDPELELPIGDQMEPTAIALYNHLRQTQPQLQYGPPQ